MEDIYSYKTNSATINNLKEGDNLITKNGKIIKQATENLVEDKEEDKKVKENLKNLYNYIL